MDDIVAGRYRLEEPIGSGGMAEVWRAVDIRTGSTVAVKRLHPGTAADPAARARLRREIEAARAVVHPAAVRILDAGIDDDSPWLVMDHVAGGSLADRLATGTELPADDGARIGADVAGALSALHAAGIVHRDVTPSNILLPLDGGARLADFGIARTWDGSALEDVTRTGDLVGTLRFVAPEVLAGEPAGPAADVWALGAVLYEAVSGRRPFDASSPTALLESQRTVPSMDGIDPALAPLLDRMLDPEPAGRPAATDVESALTGIAGHVPAAEDGTIAEEGTVVMATAVPSRAAGAAIEPVAIGAIAPARPAAAAGASGAVGARAPQPSGRRARARMTNGGRPPAPAILAVGLLLLAAVALGASSFGAPTSSGVPSAPPARTVVATPAPSATPVAEEQDGNAGPGDKAKNDDKDHDKDKGNGNGKGKGNGNGKGGGD
jgi:eukaryotic-like serine/threonine-protein kinase